MHLWQDGLVALLAAIGLASLLWAVVRGLFFSRPRTRPAALALLPARGDGERLEEQVRELAALDRDSGCFSAILLADCNWPVCWPPPTPGCGCAVGRSSHTCWTGTAPYRGPPPGPGPGEITKEQAHEPAMYRGRHHPQPHLPK